MEEQKTTINRQRSALSAINTDLANLLTGINSLNDVTGVFSSLSISSSDASILTAAVDSGAAADRHTVTVNNLATTSSYYTGESSSGSATLSPGSFELQIGTDPAVAISINDTNNTLDKLASSINGLDAGVTASVVADSSGARLALISSTTGAAGNLTISNNTTGLEFTKAVDGVNASLTVDGVPVSSASNTVRGVISGVTLTLDAGNPDSTVTVSVSADTSKALAAINSFVEAYNTLITDINSQFACSTDASSAGVLSGDVALQIVQQTILKDSAYGIPGNDGYVNLASIGIAMSDDGTLTIDSSALSNALNSDFPAVKNLFQSTSTTGFAANFKRDLSTFTSSTSGPLNAESNSLDQELSDLNNQIADFETTLTQKANELTTQYSTVNSTLQGLPVLLKEVNSEIDSLRSA